MDLPVVNYKKILFATDLSGAARCAFAHAASLAERYGATITVLHVIEELPDLDVRIIAHIGEAKWSELKSQSESNVKNSLLMKKRDNILIKDALRQFCAATTESSQEHDRIDLKIRIKRGDPCEQIMQCCREEDCNLIVIGQYRHHGKLKSSMAKELTMQPPIPVLVVGLPEC